MPLPFIPRPLHYSLQLGPIASEILQKEILITINTSEGLACYSYSKYVKFIKINVTHEKLRA